MRPLLDPQIAEVLARGGRVVAASMRAARALRRAYAEDARARGEQSWPAPRISDWSNWIASLYETLSLESEQSLPQPISALQEEFLWRRVQHEDAARVVSPGRLAALAAEAYSLLGSYDANVSRRAPWAAEAGEDAEQFLQWADNFDSECTRLEVTSRSQLESLVRAHADALIASNYIEQELLLLGFDQLTPSRVRLLDKLAVAGILWKQALPAAPLESEQPVQLISATNESTEIAACAQWVREQMLLQPGVRIGVLAPQLTAVRAEIERGFRRVLLPADYSLPEPPAALYEFSLGDPLSTMPNIAAALLLLQWLTRPLAAAEVSNLLVGGFLASTEGEAAQLAQTDALLRKRGLLRVETSLRSLLKDSDRCGDLLPATVHTRLQNLYAWVLREGAERRTYTDWAEQVPSVLTMLGWPGIADRSSIPFQAEQRWSSLIDETAQLGFAGSRVGWTAYLADLRNAASSTLFAAESADAPVQIVGISEASGQTFDALWVLGMTEDNWPPRGRPHPFLPPWLQREHGMPHASPHIDLALAEEQLRRVQTSAPRVVWSYALQAGGVDQRPSPMLSLGVGDLEATHAVERDALPASATVSVADTLTGLPWPTEQIAGGSEVLKRQAACGFQGFARGRLSVAPLEPEAWGLNAAERGTLLHRALENLWSKDPVEEGSQRLHSQQDLLRAIEDDTIPAYVQTAVTAALQPLLRRASSTDAADRWMQGVVALEAERLTKRLLFWLEQESSRAPFHVVATEKEVNDARIGDLRLHLRLDRADIVADNCLLLLDYKTAEHVSVKQWQGERPEEPQLPIYALYGNAGQGLAEAPGDVAAVAFAQIRAGDGKTALYGLAEDPAEQLGTAFSTPEGRPPRHVLSEEMRDEWDTTLRALASAFLHGEAQVNPRDGAKTCRTCNLFALCRVRSQSNSTLLRGSTDEAEEAADA